MIITRKIASNILLFVEALLLTLIALTFTLKTTILNEKYIIKQMKKTNYYDTVYEEIKDTMKYITRKSGYNDKIIDDTFTIEDVKNDTNKFVKSIYKNEELELNTEHLKENITLNLEDYINSKNKIRTEEQKKEYIDKIISTYKNEIRLSKQLKNLNMNKTVKINNKLNIIFIIDLIIIIIINKKIFNKKEYDTITITAALSLIGINIFIKMMNISNLFIYNITISELIKRIINKSTLVLIPFILLYIASSALIYYINKRKIKY